MKIVRNNAEIRLTNLETFHAFREYLEQSAIAYATDTVDNINHISHSRVQDLAHIAFENWIADVGTYHEKTISSMWEDLAAMLEEE